MFCDNDTILERANMHLFKIERHFEAYCPKNIFIYGNKSYLFI